MERLLRRWGKRVVQARRRAGLTQKQLGTRAGVTQQTISSIERGKGMPRDDLKLRIARALEVDPGELFPLAAAPNAEARRRKRAGDAT